MAAIVAAEPAAAAAGGAAVSALGKAWDRRHEIMAGTRGAIELAKSGKSGGSKLANALFTVRGRKKTAREIMNKIKNPVKTVKQASKYVASGKALKAIESAADKAGTAIDIAEGISGKDLSSARGAVKGAKETATSYHDTVSKYNDEGRDLFRPPAPASLS